jgi:hypothetical protein
MASGWPSNRMRIPCLRSSPVRGSNSYVPKRWTRELAEMDTTRNTPFLWSISAFNSFCQNQWVSSPTLSRFHKTPSSISQI